MSTAPAPVIEPVDVLNDVDHFYCCDSDWSICGIALDEVEECGWECPHHNTCPMCAETWNDPNWVCPRCGRGSYE